MSRRLVLLALPGLLAGCRGSSTGPVGSASATGSSGGATASATSLAPPPAGATWDRRPLSCSPVSMLEPRPLARGWSAYATGATETLQAVLALDSGEVWIAGDAGTLLHTLDHGTTFVRCAVDTDESLAGLWAGSPDEVWIFGDRHVYRIEGRVTLATLSVQVAGIRAPEGLEGASTATVLVGGQRVGADRVFATGHELWATVPFSAVHSADDGLTWTDSGWRPQTENTVRIRGSSADDVWIVASMEGLFHSTDRGVTWTSEGPPRGRGGGSLPMQDLYAAGAGWAFAAGGGLWVRPGRPPWVREARPDVEVMSMGGTSRSDVWAVGVRGAVLHRP